MVGQVLTSWKEIAAYLGKGVRTVQRWEAEMGLPVRRPGPERHIVIAVPAELDEWVRRSQYRAPIPEASMCESIKDSTGSARMQMERLRLLMHSMVERLNQNRENTLRLMQTLQSKQSILPDETPRDLRVEGK